MNTPPTFSSSHSRPPLAFGNPLTLSTAHPITSASNSAGDGSRKPIQADDSEAERMLLSVELGHLEVVTHMEQQTTIPSLVDLFLTVSGLCTGGATPQDRMNTELSSILFDQKDH
jgi:hypothetical protein